MNYKLSLAVLLLLGTLNTNANIVKSDENNSSIQSEKTDDNIEDPETKALELKEKKISLHNTLIEENLKSEHSALLSKLQKLKWEKELLTEKFELKELASRNRRFEEEVKQEAKIQELEYTTKVESLKNEKINNKMKLEEAKWQLKISKLQSEIEVLETTKRRDKYVNTEPVYLDNPLTDKGSLVISDRRISINGTIRKATAVEISEKINYFNNKDSKKPIFIVIDSSPGGSAMAGYLILKAMKGSKAPIYVVLKGYAASMAAIIVTLADKSYAYAHATILHHQPSSRSYGNLTKQKENYEQLKEWWIEFGGATASKMGITLEEFKAEMYKHSSDGDWRELAINAQKLNWVNHIVDTIVDTSILEEPKEKKKRTLLSLLNFQETLNEKGRTVVYLPRLSPADAYFLYNPDDYYQFR
jgi:ATP-dependent Clp protease protease subunit